MLKNLLNVFLLDARRVGAVTVTNFNNQTPHPLFISPDGMTHTSIRSIAESISSAPSPDRKEHQSLPAVVNFSLWHINYSGWKSVPAQETLKRCVS